MEDLRHQNPTVYDTPAYKVRKRRFGDRKDGRKLRSLTAMHYVEPFIMKERNDAQNFFEDVIDITNAESYLAEKHKAGYTDLSLLHIILAGYVRVVSERPGINRFIAGQRIYAHNTIECVMDIKKEMSLEAPDTCIKVEFDPRDAVLDVYKKFQTVAHRAVADSTDFDKTAKLFTFLPRLMFRLAMSVLRCLDYFGLMPKKLIRVSPFHGSLIITSMGSLGIPAIYHHLYNFGTLPIFVSYGNIYSAEAVKADGTRERHRFVTIKVVTDERICDGYYFASAFKRLKRYILHPEILDKNLTEVKEDVD